MLDAKPGIYRFDELLVLRQTLVPAVLLEVGMIVAAGDETYVADGTKHNAIVDATVTARRAYRHELAKTR